MHKASVPPGSLALSPPTSVRMPCSLRASPEFSRWSISRPGVATRMSHRPDSRLRSLHGRVAGIAVEWGWGPSIGCRPTQLLSQAEAAAAAGAGWQRSRGSAAGPLAPLTS